MMILDVRKSGKSTPPSGRGRSGPDFGIKRQGQTSGIKFESFQRTEGAARLRRKFSAAVKQQNGYGNRAAPVQAGATFVNGKNRVGSGPKRLDWNAPEVDVPNDELWNKLWRNVVLLASIAAGYSMSYVKAGAVGFVLLMLVFLSHHWAKGDLLSLSFCEWGRGLAISVAVAGCAGLIWFLRAKFFPEADEK